MKVLLVNGSPHEKGCTYTALSEVERILQEEGLDTEIFHIGTKSISGCLACGSCRKTGRCVISDSVNEFLEKAKDADGFVFGSPVHYAAMGGAMTSFMDRAFYAAIGSDMFYLKPGACVVSARRAGTTAAFDQFIKYLTIREMPVISSQYWNVVHGNTPDEVKQDLEGMQIMRTLARNMAWFLRCKEAAEQAGVALPQKEQRVATNFIR